MTHLNVRAAKAVCLSQDIKSTLKYWINGILEVSRLELAAGTEYRWWYKFPKYVMLKQCSEKFTLQWVVHYFWETFPYAPQNICHCCVTATGIVKGEYGNNPVGNSMQWRVLFVLSSSLAKLSFLSSYTYRYAERPALVKRFTFRSLLE